MVALVAFLFVAQGLEQDSLAARINRLPFCLVTCDSNLGQINVQAIDGSHKRLILDFGPKGDVDRAKYGLSVSHTGAEVTIKAYEHGVLDGAVWLDSRRMPPRTEAEPVPPKNISRYHHAVYYADDPNAAPAWLDHTEGTTEEQAFTLHIGDEKYVLAIDGEVIGLHALFKPDIAFIRYGDKTCFYKFSTEQIHVVATGLTVGLFPIESASDIDLIGRNPSAVTTRNVADTSGLYMKYSWGLKSPSDLEPRNPVLAGRDSRFSAFLGTPVTEVYYEMPGWLRRLVPIDPHARPPYASRRDALRRTEVDLIVFDDAGIKSVRLDGLASSLKVNREDLFFPGGTIFGLGGSGFNSESVMVRTPDKIVKMSESVPKNWGNASVFVGSERYYGKAGVTVDTRETCHWQTVVRENKVYLTDDTRTFAINVPKDVELCSTFSTGFALLADRSTIYLVDLVEQSLVGQVPALEFAVWPSSPHEER